MKVENVSQEILTAIITINLTMIYLEKMNKLRVMNNEKALANPVVESKRSGGRETDVYDTNTLLQC